MKLYIRIILSTLIIIGVLITYLFSVYYKFEKPTYDNEPWVIYFWALLMTLIFIWHLNFSLKKIEKTKTDSIFLRFNWLEKRHVGLRRFISLPVHLAIWLAIVIVTIVLTENFKFLKWVTFGIPQWLVETQLKGYAKVFTDMCQDIGYLYPLFLSFNYVWLITIELVHSLIDWLVAGFKRTKKIPT